MSSQQVASHACFFRGARFSSRPTKECGEGLKTRSPKNVCVGGYTASNSDVTLVGIIELGRVVQSWVKIT